MFYTAIDMLCFVAKFEIKQHLIPQEHGFCVFLRYASEAENIQAIDGGGSVE
jgi:hypothetical protein